MVSFKFLFKYKFNLINIYCVIASEVDVGDSSVHTTAGSYFGCLPEGPSPSYPTPSPTSHRFLSSTDLDYEHCEFRSLINTTNT